MGERTAYVLGSDDTEIARLDAQASSIGPALCAALTRSLAPQIVAQGIATEAELGLETLQERIAQQVGALDAVIMPPAVVGAWGTRPSMGV